MPLGHFQIDRHLSWNYPLETGGTTDLKVHEPDKPSLIPWAFFDTGSPNTRTARYFELGCPC